jgi:hypothetical protein
MKRSLSRAIWEPSKPGSIIASIITYSEKIYFWLIGLIGITPLLLVDDNDLRILTPNFIFSLIIFATIIVLLRFAIGVFDFFQYFYESRPVSRSDVIVVQKSLDSTTRFIAKAGVDKPTFGHAVEIFAHPFLDRRLSDNGWDPLDLTINDDKRFYDSSAFVEQNKPVAGENGRKYFVRSYSNPFADDSKKLTLNLGQTDWVNLINIRDKLEEDEELRHRLMKVNFERNDVPSSLCLHFVCLTKDFEFFALKRRPQTKFFPNAMSISFEEQFSSEDMERAKDKRAEAWFQRAICEEVFPLAGFYRSNPAAAWDAVSEYVKYKRIWSCFWEEDSANVSLMGVMQLNLSASEFVEISQEMQIEYNSRRDDEGRIYVFRKEDVAGYLQTGRARCRKLFSPKEVEIIDYVHPSTLYRVSGVMACLQL